MYTVILLVLQTLVGRPSTPVIMFSLFLSFVTKRMLVKVKWHPILGF